MKRPNQYNIVDIFSAVDIGVILELLLSSNKANETIELFKDDLRDGSNIKLTDAEVAKLIEENLVSCTNCDEENNTINFWAKYTIDNPNYEKEMEAYTVYVEAESFRKRKESMKLKQQQQESHDLNVKCIKFKVLHADTLLASPVAADLGYTKKEIINSNVAFKRLLATYNMIHTPIELPEWFK